MYIVMKIVWLLAMGANLQGILLLTFMTGIALGLLVDKLTKRKSLTMLAAILPVIIGVVTIIKILISNWGNLSFEKPLLTGIVSLVVFVAFKFANDCVLAFFIKVAFGEEKEIADDTILVEEIKGDSVKSQPN